MFQCVKPTDEATWWAMTLVAFVGLWLLASGLTWLSDRFGRQSKRSASGKCAVVAGDSHKDVSLF